MSEQLGWYARLEGGDGVGKTTQLNMAKDFAKKQGIDAVFVREPGGTNFGAEIRHMLLTHTDYDLGPEVEAALFTADRRHTLDTVILPALNDNRLVISDRGPESMVAYQSARGGVDKKILWDLTRMLMPARYIETDALVILSLSESIRRKRLEKGLGSDAADKIESRSHEFAQRVHSQYESFRNELEYAHFVDANRDPEEVFETIKPLLFGKYI
jgi:dTMP kinase